TARQPSPFDRALSLFDPLLCCAAPVVESDDPLGRPRQVGNDEADARVQLARMPLDFGHNAARLAPALCLIAETGEVASHLVRWPTDRTLEQVPDPALQYAVGRKPDRVADPLGFEKVVHLGTGKGCVAPEIEALHATTVTPDHRLQHRAPAISAVHV